MTIMWRTEPAYSLYSVAPVVPPKPSKGSKKDRIPAGSLRRVKNGWTKNDTAS